MEVTVERLKCEEDRRCVGRRYYDRNELFTVHVGDENRILTMFTYSPSVMAKWISDVKKTYRKMKEPLIVGFVVERKVFGYFWHSYTVMTLCIGSLCLIFQLPDELADARKEIPQVLRDFLVDPSTIFVGMDIEAVAKKLDRKLRLKVGRKADIRSLSDKVFERVRDGPDAKNLDVCGLTKRLLDKRMDVVKEEIFDGWVDIDPIDRKRNPDFEINRKYAMNLTVDAFFCHEIGVKYTEMIIKLAK